METGKILRGQGTGRVTYAKQLLCDACCEAVDGAQRECERVSHTCCE